MGRRGVAGVAVITALLLLPSAAVEGATGPFADVEAGRWSAHVIETVAIDRDWMAVPGNKFYPRADLTRRALARAAVKAFAPDELLDPEIAFTDLAADEPYFNVANVATKLGWFPRAQAFDPVGTVDRRLLSRVLVRALGLEEQAYDLARLRTADGHRFKLPSHFAYLVLANELALIHNYRSPNDANDLYPWETATREDGAYALWAAANAGWRVWSARALTDIELPAMPAWRRQMVQFALQYAGYPYVYAGDWYRATPSGYCCGAQVQGGFDCSGFQWWVSKRATSSYNTWKVRPYSGFNIQQRRASLIAREAPQSRRVGIGRLSPGDLVFFNADGPDANWLNIDHGGVALGNGYFIHSSGSRGGVTIGSMAEGSWWRDAFVIGRKLG